MVTLDEAHTASFYSNYIKGNIYHWSGIEQLMATQDIRSVEDLLSLLPQKFRTIYTLIYRSRSLQDASEKNPRVLLFSENGLVLSFNGDPLQKNYNKIEVLSPSDDGSQISMKEIDFSGGRPIVHNNPVSCTKCHRVDSRPIWDSYAIWPGVFGSFDDIFSEKTSPPQEKLAFNNWLKAKESHPRYQKLVTPQYESAIKKDTSQNIFSVFPFVPIESFAKIAQYFDYEKLNSFRPNLRLTEILSRVQAKKISSKNSTKQKTC